MMEFGARVAALAVMLGSTIAGASLMASEAMAQAAGAPPAGASEPRVSVADRTAQVEGRLIDLQVQLATQRSLQGAASGPQIQAIEGEMRTLARELTKLSGRPSNIRAGTTTALAPTAGAPNVNSGFTNQSAGSGTVGRASWGATTVTPGGAETPAAPGELRRDQVYPQGSADSGTTERTAAAWDRPAAPAPFTAQQPQRAAIGPEQEYQAAYSSLLQQDYGAAEVAFREFVARHATSSLAGNAQYWLGETHYVRGAYREAAVAFLKAFEKYGDGSKGADSLLKLGLSLARLNQKNAACSSLTEVKRRYASAPQSLLDRARREATDLSCPK